MSLPAFAQEPTFTPTSDDDFPVFPDDVTPLIPLSSQIPGDFFSPAKGPVERTPDRLQHDFDIYSWETFIALCWPANPDGTPKKVDPNVPAFKPDVDGYFTYPHGTVWENWMPADAVFRDNAAEPIEWGKVAPARELYGASKDAESRLMVEVDSTHSKGIKSLEDAQAKKIRSISWVGTNFAGAVHGQNTKTLHEMEQAVGTGRLIDNNGYFVRYEVLMNRDVYDFIVKNRFFDQASQEAYVLQKKRIVFPIGKFEVDAQNPMPAPPAGERRPKTANVGSIVVKAGWKRLSPEEFASGRFYAVQAVTQRAGEEGGKSLAHFGLIALHIAHKSADVAQWTWSTFEHDDNCPDIRTVGYEDADTKRYSFFDPLVFKRVGYRGAQGYPEVNVLSDLVALPKPITEPLAEQHRSRLVRIVPLTRDVTAINRQFKAKFGNAVWKNYSLVSTQWPLEPAGVFLGQGEIAAGALLRQRRNYADLDGDVEKYNLKEFAMDPRRLVGALPDRSAADRQLGFPDPRFLANSIIETSLQGTITANENGQPLFRAGVEHGSSSCMHCHGDAKTFGTGRPADMSFLLSRAKPRKP
ncbi:MAG: hypothetical protein V4773_30920 [Verrucomicrobiota bacterium]